MKNQKIVQCAEGLIVTLAGLVFGILSLKIRNNPIQVEGYVNLLVQAKFVPLVLSLLITIQGVDLTIALLRSKEARSDKGRATKRSVLVLLLTITYLVLVSWIGFAVPTVFYLCTMLFLVNKGDNPKFLLLLTAAYAIIALVLIPVALNLQLL